MISDALARSGSDHPNPGKSSIGISTRKIHILEQGFPHLDMFQGIFQGIFQVHLKISAFKNAGKMANWLGLQVELPPLPGSRKSETSEDQEIRFWGINQ